MDKKKKDKEMKEQEIKEFDKLHAPTMKRTVSYSSKTFFVDALKKMVEDQILVGPPIWRVPSEMVVGPVNWELFPVRIVVPAPAWFNDPLPIMVEVMVVVLV